MGRTRSYLFILTLVVVFVFSPEIVDAQCAMCKAVLENEYTANGNKKSSGINSGIMFLMGIPYLLIGAAIFYVIKYNGKKVIDG